MVYGTMGSDGQPQTQCAVFTRTATYSLDPQDAISRPRWLLGRTWGQTSDNLKLETRFSPWVAKELHAMEHEIEMLDAFDETVLPGISIMAFRHGLKRLLAKSSTILLAPL